MSKTIQLRNLVIGEGRPKICVPVMGVSKQQIWEEATRLEGRAVDLVEWRADLYEHLSDQDKVREVLKMLRNLLGDIPLLFTIRTRREGGEIDISVEDYIYANTEAMKTGFVDMVDVEVARGDDVAYMIVEAAHDNGIKVIGSYHDFQRTPKKEDIIMRLCKMQEVEADIAKIAVMPVNERDVLTLLDATLAMKELHGETPVVTMSMGNYGRISRISGELFGSAITFGMVGKASAPGQMPVEILQECMEYIAVG